MGSFVLRLVIGLVAINIIVAGKLTAQRPSTTPDHSEQNTSENPVEEKPGHFSRNKHHHHRSSRSTTPGASEEEYTSVTPNEPESSGSHHQPLNQSTTARPSEQEETSENQKEGESKTRSRPHHHRPKGALNPSEETPHSKPPHHRPSQTTEPHPSQQEDVSASPNDVESKAHRRPHHHRPGLQGAPKPPRQELSYTKAEIEKPAKRKKIQVTFYHPHTPPSPPNNYQWEPERGDVIVNHHHHDHIHVHDCDDPSLKTVQDSAEGFYTDDATNSDFSGGYHQFNRRGEPERGDVVVNHHYHNHIHVHDCDDPSLKTVQDSAEGFYTGEAPNSDFSGGYHQFNRRGEREREDIIVDHDNGGNKGKHIHIHIHNCNSQQKVARDSAGESYTDGVPNSDSTVGNHHLNQQGERKRGYIIFDYDNGDNNGKDVHIYIHNCYGQQKVVRDSADGELFTNDSDFTNGNHHLNNQGERTSGDIIIDNENEDNNGKVVHIHIHNCNGEKKVVRDSAGEFYTVEVPNSNFTDGHLNHQGERESEDIIVNLDKRGNKGKDVHIHLHNCNLQVEKIGDSAREFYTDKAPKSDFTGGCRIPTVEPALDAGLFYPDYDYRPFGPMYGTGYHSNMNQYYGDYSFLDDDY